MKKRAIIFIVIFALLAALFTVTALAADVLPDGYVGVYYKNYVADSKEDSCWFTNGDFPPGLSYGMDSKGHFIYGTPELAGTWSFTMHTSNSGSTNYVITIIDIPYYCVRVSLMRDPYKMTYRVGESFDPSGIIVYAYYENELGHEKQGDITNEIYFYGSSFTVPGTETVTLCADLPDYDGSLTTFTIPVQVTVIDNKPKVEAPVINTKELPDAVAGKSYSFDIKYTGSGVGFSEYHDSGATNQLAAAGLSISSGGRISGTPKKPGKYTFTICAKNDGGTVYQKYTLTVRQSETAGDGLWVGGVEVSEKNRTDILGDGSASFDKTNGVLTLDTASITKHLSKEGFNCAIYSELPALRIRLIGENTLELSGGKAAGIYAKGGALTIEGGKLDILASSGGSVGIFAGKDIVIDGAGLTVEVAGTAVRTDGKLIYVSGTALLSGTENALAAKSGFENRSETLELREGSEAPGEAVDAISDASASAQYIAMAPKGTETMHLGGIGGTKDSEESEADSGSAAGQSGPEESHPEQPQPDTKAVIPAKWLKIALISVGGVLVAGGATAGITAGVSKSRKKKQQ